MKLLKILFLATLVIFFSNCKKDKPVTPNEIYMNNSVFEPSSITVSKGTTITWTNKESMIHTVTSDSLFFNSGDMNKNITFSYTFNTAGTYKYRCIYHSNMKGTVTVQ